MAAGIRRRGLAGALVYEGGTTAEACEGFVRGSLGPCLRPGDIVIMDNLSSHADPTVVEVWRDLGVTVKQLPPYSPDLNPIEKAWSKVKQAVRKARPQTVAALIDAVAAALRTITLEDIRGWFAHCGYHTDS